MDTTFNECIAVENLPVVDEAKKPKLITVLKKIFAQVGNVVRLDMPMGADGNRSSRTPPFPTTNQGHIT